MRLRRPCQHDRYEAHRLLANAFGEVPEYAVCPGGEFLPGDAVVVNPTVVVLLNLAAQNHQTLDWAKDLISTLRRFAAGQVGEPG